MKVQNIKLSKTTKTKTEAREKIAVWLDHGLVAALREIQEKVGVPVGESIRRAVGEYVAKQEVSRK